VDESRLERHYSWSNMKEHEFGPSHAHLRRGCVQARADALPAIRGLALPRAVVVESTRRWKRTCSAMVHSEHASVEFYATGVRSDRECARPCAQRIPFPACQEPSGGGRNRASPCRQPSGGGRNRAYPCRHPTHLGQVRLDPVLHSTHLGQVRLDPVLHSTHLGQVRLHPVLHSTHLGQVRLHPVLHPVPGGGIPFNPNPVPTHAVRAMFHSLPDSGSSRRSLLQRRLLSSGERQVPLRPCREGPCRPKTPPPPRGERGRREGLDHVIVVNQRHLNRILAANFRYYDGRRTHQALEMDCPEAREVHHVDRGRVSFPP